MELIRNWITGVTAASVLVSAALAVTPEGAVKKVVKFVGGLLMFIVLTSPLREIDISDIAYYNMQYRADYEKYEEKLIYKNSSMIKTIIEDKIRSYILQKAEEMGLQCDAQVHAKKRVDGYPYPERVVIITESDPDPALKKKLSYILESELGITDENQEWRQTEDE